VRRKNGEALSRPARRFGSARSRVDTQSVPKPRHPFRAPHAETQPTWQTTPDTVPSHAIGSLASWPDVAPRPHRQANTRLASLDGATPGYFVRTASHHCSTSARLRSSRTSVRLSNALGLTRGGRSPVVSTHCVRPRPPSGPAPVRQGRLTINPAVHTEKPSSTGQPCRGVRA
jgi:hypothetical protein